MPNIYYIPLVVCNNLPLLECNIKALVKLRMNENYYRTLFLLSEIPVSWPSNFAIITAENPMDQKMTEVENAKRTNRLIERMGQRKHTYMLGCSENYSHQEKSFAVVIDFDEAVSIGKEFDQRAIFYVEQGKLLLVDCNNGERTQMGNFEDRIRKSKILRNTYLSKTNRQTKIGT